MEKKWTNEQQNAINLQKKHLLISAGAGSGKTAVLVERILHKVMASSPQVDINSLLIVTFTRAAAFEMRERISKAIYRALSADPHNERLQKQLSLLPICDITTIDSFCLNLIKNNAIELDIDSSFAILDNMESEMLKAEVLDETLEELYENPSTEFLLFADSFAGLKSDDPIKDIILSSYSFLRSLPFYLDWLSDKVSLYQKENAFDTWARIILDDFEGKIAHAVSCYDTILASYPGDEKAQKSRGILENEKAFCQNIYKAVHQKNWDDTYAALQSAQFVTLRMSIKDKDLAEEYKSLRSQAKNAVTTAKEELILSDTEHATTDIKKLYPILQGFYEAVALFDEKLLAEKKERNRYEFSDTEHLALALLSHKNEDGSHVPSKLATELSQNYSEILIDEYQDTNALQEMIFNFVGDSANRFYVGDLKQSIYKFRHANPYIFRHKTEVYSADTTCDDVKIQLAKNFRSRESVLAGINTIFSMLMTHELGDVDYQNGESLSCGAPYAPWQNAISDKTQVLLIDKKEENAENVTEELSGSQKEALAIAHEIKTLMNGNFKVEQDGKLRPLKFRDIVVLMRSPGPSSGEYSEVFVAEGIPLYSDTSGEYFNASEIATMLSLLEIIDNPLNDIPLAAVLRSPLFHFDDNELLSIKLAGDFPYFYQNVQETSKGEETLSKKCFAFLSQLLDWQRKASYLPVSELIWSIYEDTDFFSVCAVMDYAEKKIANLRVLYYKAKQYESNHFRGLYQFIDFMGRIKLNGGDMGEAKIMAENQDVVRIMSIHKSKGLEFPIVFCAGLGKRFNQKDLSHKILLHSDLGLGLDYVDNDLPYSYPNLSRIALKLALQNENLSEEMRLLYVAMTRAKEKLYLTAGINDTPKQFDKWQSAVSLSDKQWIDYLKSHGYFVDWIMPCILKANNILSFPQLTGESDSHLFSVHLVKAQSLSLPEEESVKKGNTVDYQKIIADNFNYRYPFMPDTVADTKVSVSELNTEENTRNLYKETVLNKTPEFLRESSKPTGAQIGTLNHLIMQKIDLHATTPSDIQSLISKLIYEGFILEKEANYIHVEEIARFFTSDLGMRLQKSSQVYRETSFEIPAKSGAIVQGIIDCFFVENNDIILIDYKTNAAHTPINELKQKYQTQIDIYAEAITKIMKKAPKEKFIYLFSEENVIRYD